MQLNTVRSNAADIQKHKIIHTTTPTYTRHPADRALCHQAGDVSMHRRISPALPVIRVAFAPERSCSHLHLHFFALHHANKTGAMSIPPSPYTAGTYHAAPAVSKCTVSRAQSESCCRVSSALNLCYLQTAPTQTHKTTSFFLKLFVFFLSILGMFGPLVSDSADGEHGF